MQQRLVIRYSMNFKRQVVSELESGRFDSIVQASEHYGITGSMTIRKWLGKFSGSKVPSCFTRYFSAEIE